MQFDGLSSGLNTTQLIEQIMTVERVPVDSMTTRRDAARAAVDAFGSIKSKLSAIASAATALERSTGWNVRTAASSDASLASVSAAAGASIGSFTFKVDRLAKVHGVATTADVATTATTVAAGPTVSLTVGATTSNVNVGGGSLAEVVSAINAANVGVRAAAVNTGAGFRLQLTAARSGDDGVFSIGGLNLATAITNQGQDAKLTFGTGPGAYDVTSSTNTFSEIVPGVTVVAKQPSATEVTVTIAANGAALADRVEALANSVNGAMAEISTRTAYDPSSRRAATLAGDSAVRQASQALQRAVSEAVTQSALGTPGAAGVGLDRNGKVTFDRAKFLAAYEKDPVATEKLFTQHATTTGDMTFASAGARSTAGPRNVVVTAAAAQASQVGMVGSFPVTTPATIRVKVGTTEIVFSATVPMSAADVKNGLQAAIDAQKLDLAVSESGGGIEVRTNGYGVNARFDIDWGSGSYATVSGLDVQGTIGGVTATGTGRQLSVPTTDSTNGGLSVNLTSNATGTIGVLDYEPGLAARLSAAVTAATDSATGYITSAQNGRQSRVDLLSRSITSYDQRLEIRENRLRKEFASLEVSLSRIREQSTFLAGQLNGLSSS